MALTSLRAASASGLPAVLRVLVIDRSTATARAVRTALEREPGVRVHVARGPGSAAKLIEQEAFDAVLIEQQLWNGGASTLGKMVREERPDLAVVVVTDDTSAEAGLGVHECIARDDVEQNTLLQRLGSAISETRGARRRETMVRWLERDARTDRTSGLFNRAAFNERLREACRIAMAASEPVSVIAIEVQTDANGRDESGALTEMVIRRAAAGVSRAVRSADFAARSSESTLAVLVPGAGIDLARRMARRMAQEVDRLNAAAWPDETPVTLAFGVASGIECTAEELIAAAEANLRQAASEIQRSVTGPQREERDGPSVA